MTARTSVVVLNWNGGPDTLECLQSLVDGDPSVARYVVDNGSTDGSAERIEASGLADAVIRTGRNLGYAGGNNTGLERALADGATFVAVLNNDTVVPPGVLTALAGTLAARPDPAGAAISPRIVQGDGDARSLWFAGGTVDRGWPRHLQPAELEGVAGLVGSDLLTGCALVAHRELWERVGGFDDGFFLIFEDSDWSMRARSGGTELLVHHDLTIDHKVSRSFRAPRERRLATYYFVRNGLVFERRWAARHLGRFVLTWILRPTVRALRDRQVDRDLAMRWIALLAAVGRRRGPAPPRLGRWAAGGSHGAAASAPPGRPADAAASP